MNSGVTVGRRLAVVALAALLLLLPASAHATFAGANGKLAFYSSSFGSLPSGIYTMNPDGSSKVALLLNVPGPGGGTVWAPWAWTPDGTKLTVTRRESPGLDPIYTIYPDGSGLTQIGFGDMPDWSPDGQRLVFTNNHDLFIMEADGTGVKQITQNPPCVSSDPAYHSLEPAWSPDGKKIAFKRTQELGCDTDEPYLGPSDLYVIDADGTNQTLLAAPGSRPDWSPEGSKIAFNGYVNGTGGVTVMNADGSAQTVVAPSNWSEPVWSPDGQKLAFQSDVSKHDVFLSNPDGSGLIDITNTPNDFEFYVQWQPLPGSSPPPPYPTPKLAGSLRAALVPVFKQCGTAGNPANASHSPPFATGSCNPPSPSSASARFGAQASGFAQLGVIYGDTNSANGDQADVTIRSSLSDVQTTAGADYDPASGPDLTLVTRLRFTDRSNGGSGTDPGTAGDSDFAVPIDCAASASTSVGSDCGVDTSTDAIMPGVIKENAATVLQVFRFRLNDLGPNGVRGDSDDKVFASEGLFAP